MSGGPRIGLATRHSSKPTALSLRHRARIRPAVTSSQIGPTGATNLTASAADYRGTTRAGGNVAALARAHVLTRRHCGRRRRSGRVFISKNADTTNTSVTYTRLDSLAANSPARFVSSIFVDPADPNHAWISYSSYSSLTPATPGHVFSVTYDPGAGTATWTNLDGSGATAFPDFPATGVAFDSVTGDLYASNDWGVLRLAHGSTDWEVAGTGLPDGRSRRPHDSAECAKALCGHTRPERLATDIAVKLRLVFGRDSENLSRPFFCSYVSQFLQYSGFRLRLCWLLAGSALINAAPTGFVEGHLKIISPKEVELADATPSKNAPLRITLIIH